GNVAATYMYEPFGKPVSSAGTVANPWRWLGGLGVYWDSQLLLYKIGTRYYDPALGRFIQADPVRGGSANAYDYSFQDPINLADPSGEAGCTYLPDQSWASYDFGDACDAHDTCYGTWGKTRRECDELFKREALKDCRSRRWGLRHRCDLQAELWFQLLRHEPVTVRIAHRRYRSGQFNKCPYRIYVRRMCRRLIDKRDD
ncbi:MAG: RHS repeat-associated core domain-containing protein, partial [Gammaproteobacteria bacterium]